MLYAAILLQLLNYDDTIESTPLQFYDLQRKKGRNGTADSNWYKRLLHILVLQATADCRAGFTAANTGHRHKGWRSLFEIRE